MMSYPDDNKLPLHSPHKLSSSHPYPAVNPTAEPQGKFIVFAHFRSGSGLLCDLLNLHPDIHCDYEILYPFLASQMKPNFLLLFIKGLIARTEAKIYGCGLKLDQLNSVHQNPRQFMQDRYHEGWKIIYLKRFNILRAAISNFIAAQRQQYSLPKDSPAKLAKTYIECDELLNLLNWYGRIADQEAEVLAVIPHLKLGYEADLLEASRHQQTLDRIFDYLGVATAPVQAKSRRTSRDHLSDYIENYEEIVKFVRQTNYARYLDLT